MKKESQESGSHTILSQIGVDGGTLINVLAVIPARGASKGIPRKNVRILAGKPLIEYTIEQAQQAHSVSCHCFN